MLFPLPVTPFPWLSLRIWTDGSHLLIMVVFSHRLEDASPAPWPGEQRVAVAIMHSGIASAALAPRRL